MLWKSGTQLTLEQSTCSLTFPDHWHSNRHAHQLALGPDMSVDTHSLFLTFTIEAWYRWMVGNLLCHKTNTITVWLSSAAAIHPSLWGPGNVRSSCGCWGGTSAVSSPERSNTVLGHIPGTVKVLTQDGCIGFLCHSTLPALMKGSQVVLDKANDTLFWCSPRGDGEEHIRVSNEVRIHL